MNSWTGPSPVWAGVLGRRQRQRRRGVFVIDTSNQTLMANLSQSLSMNAAAFGIGGPSTSAANIAIAMANKDRKMASAEQLVLDLSNPELRENALLELSKVTLGFPILMYAFSLVKMILFFIFLLAVSCHQKCWIIFTIQMFYLSHSHFWVWQCWCGCMKSSAGIGLCANVDFANISAWVSETKQ